jgi:ribosomal protein S18 acetylase RimI-like enzyme
MLFRHAEKIAEEYGNDTLYNYVHPNNDRMLRFLAKMGYDVLNLIEVRKAGKNENTPDTYTIGNNTFKY